MLVGCSNHFRFSMLIGCKHLFQVDVVIKLATVSKYPVHRVLKSTREVLLHLVAYIFISTRYPLRRNCQRAIVNHIELDKRAVLRKVLRYLNDIFPVDSAVSYITIYFLNIHFQGYAIINCRDENPANRIIEHISKDKRHYYHQNEELGILRRDTDEEQANDCNGEKGHSDPSIKLTVGVGCRFHRV